MQLTEVRRYPVKSCAGDRLASAVVEPWGLEGDRRWMLVDPDGEAVTAREVNDLLLVHPEATATGLRLTAPGRDSLDVEVPGGDPVPVRIGRSDITATPAGDDAHAWFSAVVGTDVRLVWLDDPTRRHANPAFAREDDLVSLADGYPLLLTTEASLTALDDAVRERAQGDHEPLDMLRFRPNVVVAGGEPWAEDDWRRIRIGEAVFRSVKGCIRCVMTTVDPHTAVRGKEPIATLARTRRFDGGTWFGVNLVPDLPAGGERVSIHEGDDVEVLDAVAPGDGPIRP